jgi:hypothetical protein
LNTRFLSFAIPVVIIVLAFAILSAIRAAERSHTRNPRRNNLTFWIWLGIILVITLAAMAAAIYNWEIIG